MGLQEGKTFAEKHGDGISINADIQHHIHEHEKDGKVSCAVAFEISKQLSVSPKVVGTAIDLMNLKIVKCQIGLFGYASGKKIKAEPFPGDRLKAAILAASVDKRLSCFAVWHIAEDLEIGKMAVGNACEALGIKIKPCQLGAF